MFALRVAPALLALSFLPLLSLAQDTGPAVPNYCPNLTVTMQKCDPNRPLLQQRCTDATTGGQVTELQRFLSDYYDLNPNDYVTGYFGRLTRDNVRKFQCERMNICGGDESTTGYGVVGPMTRAAIKAHCGVQTTTNNNPPPPTQPTCTLNANPSSITLGQSSTLTWSSTNTTGVMISTIGTVSTNGSQSVTPILTTTYTGIFWGAGGTATCATTVTVTSQTTTNSSCTFNNQSIPDGQPVTAYQAPTVPAGTQCLSQTRTCHNGTLDGTYQNATCQVLPPVTTAGASCVYNGQTYIDEHTLTVPGDCGNRAVAWCPPKRFTCSNGQWSNCQLLDPYGQPYPQLQCTAPLTSAITGGAIGNTGVGLCTYKGQSYAEGANINVQFFSTTIPLLCDNGVWVRTDYEVGQNVCDSYGTNSILSGDLGCGEPVARTYLTVVPRHGRSPLTVTVRTYSLVVATNICAADTLSWGDGSPGSFPQRTCDGSQLTVESRTHTYTSPGSYVISYTHPQGQTNSATIRVDPAGTASIQNQSPNQSQLASALAALESALKALLKLLGQ